MGCRCLRRRRQAAKAGATCAIAARNARSDFVGVFAAIIWRKDYGLSEDAVTHTCRSNTILQTSPANGLSWSCRLAGPEHEPIKTRVRKPIGMTPLHHRLVS